MKPLPKVEPGVTQEQIDEAFKKHYLTFDEEVDAMKKEQERLVLQKENKMLLEGDMPLTVVAKIVLIPLLVLLFSVLGALLVKGC